MNQGSAFGTVGLKLQCICLALLLGSISGAAKAQDSIPLNRFQYEGTLGTNRIGLTAVSGGKTITGHYFYAKYLTNIPLTGSMQSSALALTGQDNGTFVLKFVGNGSEGGKPLDFNNSVGLEGDWSTEGKSLPVKLAILGASSVSSSGRLYESVTSESDAAFEAKIQGFHRAVLTGDKAAASKYISFPLRVNKGGQHRIIHSAAQLAARWQTIFTPAYVSVLNNDLPHDLFIHDGQAMLGSGDVWFSARGVTALNLP